MKIELSQAFSEFEPMRFLGAGTEGRVYLATRKGQPRVLKVFHTFHNLTRMNENLRAYSERVGTNDAGFFPIRLIMVQDSIVGLHYEYIPLFELPFGYRHSRWIVQALLAQYCYSQAYLMREHSLQMVDVVQFLLSEDGSLHYVDYGENIVRTDDEWYRGRGCAPFFFLKSFFGLNGIRINAEPLPLGFDYHQPCLFVRPEQYDALVRRRPWTAEIVDMIRSMKAELFLDHEFYEHIARMFPRTLENPRPLLVSHRLLCHPLRRLRARLRYGVV